MTGWDYAAMGAVWYLLAARVAVGNDFHLNATTRLLWPAFLFSLVPRNLRHAGFRRQLFRTAVSLASLLIVTIAAYIVAAYVSTNVLLRFLLTFPLASIGTLILFAGGAFIYGLFDSEKSPAPTRRPAGK